MFESFEKKVAIAIEKLQSMNLGVTALNATVSGKVVTLTGETASPEVKGRVMSEFNSLIETENTINQIRINRPAPAPAPVQAEAMPGAMPGLSAAIAMGPTQGPAPSAWIHEVLKGDTLSAIAKKYYGEASKYRKIFEANRDVLDNPDLIKVGQKLRIPE